MASFLTRGKKIIAIGRNYVEHAKELGNRVPTEPFFFLKPTTSYIPSPGKIQIPQGVLAHHEIELAVVVGKSGRDIPEASAMDHVAGYALAIDMTARNIQEDVKKKGLPWTTSKGFDTFTPISNFIPRTEISDPHNLSIWIKVNGSFKQNGSTSDMIFRIPRLIEHVSSIMTLEENDVILTGTPHGVGPVKVGDDIVAGLSVHGNETLLASLSFQAEARSGGYHFHQ